MVFSRILNLRKKIAVIKNKIIMLLIICLDNILFPARQKIFFSFLKQGSFDFLQRNNGISLDINIGWILMDTDQSAPVH